MSKKQKKGSSTTAANPSMLQASSARGVIDIDPDLIYFTHSRVRPFFTGCNKRIEDTLEEIVNGVTSIDEIPMITVIPNDGYFFSLNNRRLFLFKSLRALGLIPNNTINAFAKPPLEREKKRYLISRCALTAKLMKEHVPGSKAAAEDNQHSSASSASEVESGDEQHEPKKIPTDQQDDVESTELDDTINTKKASNKSNNKSTKDKHIIAEEIPHNKVEKVEKDNKKKKGKKGKHAISSDEDDEEPTPVVPAAGNKKGGDKDGQVKTVFSKATETATASSSTNAKKKKGKGKKDKDDDDFPEKSSRRKRGEEDNSLEKALSHLLVDEDEDEDD